MSGDWVLRTWRSTITGALPLIQYVWRAGANCMGGTVPPTRISIYYYSLINKPHQAQQRRTGSLFVLQNELNKTICVMTGTLGKFHDMSNPSGSLGQKKNR